jgi:gamma-butyrobetaine dioxygenase
MTKDEVLDDIESLFATHGQEHYGEGVSMEQHGLQAAALAVAEGAAETLVLAALLHDVGHFLELRDDEYGYHKHDRSGSDWLAKRFPAAVSEPVRLHVAAKRYLCATESHYYDALSVASKHSLGKQGGPMNAAETTAFSALPFAEDAVRLRRWDDHGKVQGLTIPPLEAYRDLIRKHLAL